MMSKDGETLHGAGGEMMNMMALVVQDMRRKRDVGELVAMTMGTTEEDEAVMMMIMMIIMMMMIEGVMADMELRLDDVLCEAVDMTMVQMIMRRE